MKGVSKHYYTTIHVNKRDIVFIGVHLLAHPNDQSAKAKREAQADAIRELAVEQSDSLKETVIWGDCNDFDPDCPDIAGDMPITTSSRSSKKCDQQMFQTIWSV